MKQLFFYHSFVLFACVWLVAACSGRASERIDDKEMVDSIVEDSVENVIEETAMPVVADELFDDFIFNFAGNRKLQYTRIHFPLPVIHNGRPSAIKKDAWRMDHLFMTDDYYLLILDNASQLNVVNDTTLHHVSIDKIQLDNKQVKRYIFQREKGLWMLTQLEEIPMSEHPNGDFLSFYNHFATDTLFQAESLSDNVVFTAPDPEDELNNITGAMMAEQWPDFKPEIIPSGTVYNIDYGNTAYSKQQKMLIVRGIANGLETTFTFSKKSGQWRLTQFTY